MDFSVDIASDSLGSGIHVQFFEHSCIDHVSIYTLPVHLAGLINNAGQFQVQFIGDTNLSYTVVGTTNLSLPLSAWEIVGPARYQNGYAFLFTDFAALNYRQRFYRVVLP